MKKTWHYPPKDNAGNIPSPCTGVCKMDAQTQLCEGCLRTIDEIAQWRDADNSEKGEIWMRILQRAEKS